MFSVGDPDSFTSELGLLYYVQTVGWHSVTETIMAFPKRHT